MKKTLQNTLKVTGKVEMTQKQSLTFGTSGKVATILVKEGQSVKKDTLLATLDTKTLDDDIALQRALVRSAQLNYQKLFTTVTESQKSDAKNTLDQTQKTLDNTLAEKENFLVLQKAAIEQAKTSAASLEAKVTVAQRDLEYTKGSVDQGGELNATTYRDLVADSIQSIESAFADVGTIKTASDTLM